MKTTACTWNDYDATNLYYEHNYRRDMVSRNVVDLISFTLHVRVIDVFDRIIRKWRIFENLKRNRTFYKIMTYYFVLNTNRSIHCVSCLVAVFILIFIIYINIIIFIE